MSESNVEIVDDWDPRVQYSDGWGLSGSNHEFGQTTHGTFSAGSQATLTFNGSSVEVYGTIGIDHKDAPVSTYSLDGSSLQTFGPPLPDAVQYRQLFYKSPTLDEKQHILVVTSTIAESAFWLDYFQITSNAIPTPLSVPVPSATSSTSDNLVTQSSSTSVSEGPSQTSATTPTLPVNKALIGAIIGGVVGGVILVLFFCLFTLYYRRKMRSQKGFSSSSAQPDGISFGTRQVSLTNNQERGNTRFLGDISPFTVHWTSARGRGTEKTASTDEPVIPRDTANFPYPETTFWKTERLGRRGGELYNPEPPPRYS